MLIQNYGLFWKEEDVYWGKPNVSGHLKGIITNGKTGDPVDFREQQGVYVLYDDTFRVVYVGQTGVGQQRLFDRLKQHKNDNLADRWSKFSWFGIRRVNKTGDLAAEKNSATPEIGDVLNHIEAILIATAEPAHNKQGGRFGEKVEQYLQYRDKEDLGLSVPEMIKQIYDSLPSIMNN